MLRYRLLTAAVAVPVELAVIYLGSWPLVAFVSLVAVLGMREYYQLAAGPHRSACPLTPALPRAASWAGYLLAGAVPAAVLSFGHAPIAGTLVAAATVLALLAVGARWAAPAIHRALPTTAAVALVGSLLLPGLLSHLIRLRYLEPEETLRLAGFSVPRGAGWLALVMAACWLTDSAALIVGKLVGRHKLWPSVSPGKTVEGSLAGLFASLLVTLPLGLWLGLSAAQSLALGGALGVVGQIGDLAESKLKRWAGVKDSGTILPGHGGILDHFDSLLATGPFAYCYLRLLVGGS